MPSNAGYMIAAYVATALVFGGYIASLILRARAMSKRGDAIATVRKS